jgi:hypothetical protein
MKKTIIPFVLLCLFIGAWSACNLPNPAKEDPTQIANLKQDSMLKVAITAQCTHMLNLQLAASNKNSHAMTSPITELEYYQLVTNYLDSSSHPLWYNGGILDWSFLKNKLLNDSDRVVVYFALNAQNITSLMINLPDHPNLKDRFFEINLNGDSTVIIDLATAKERLKMYYKEVKYNNQNQVIPQPGDGSSSYPMSVCYSKSNLITNINEKEEYQIYFDFGYKSTRLPTDSKFIYHGPTVICTLVKTDPNGNFIVNQIDVAEPCPTNCGIINTENF